MPTPNVKSLESLTPHTPGGSGRSYRERNRNFAHLESLEKASQPRRVHEGIRKLAEDYAAKKGLKINHDIGEAKANPEFASKIAQAYHSMPHNPNDPETRKAYGALIQETADQLNHLQRNGLRFSKIQPGQDNPYKSSKDLLDDLHSNNHVWYFPTHSGFGSDEHGASSDHPLLQPITTERGEKMPANDAFRIVHDVFGHGKEGHGFGPHGEEGAWQHHIQMYSPQARRALTSETRGQNSWVNFGPHGEHNRKNPAKTVYADQKAGLLPEWTMHVPKTGAPETPKAAPVTSPAPAKKSLTKTLGAMVEVLKKSAPLEKRSKNVREQTRNIDQATVDRRAAQFGKKLGLKINPTNDDEGPLVEGNAVNPTPLLSATHEVGHAIATPPRRSMKAHSDKLLTDSRSEDQGPKARQAAHKADLEDIAIQRAEPRIARRMGVAPGKVVHPDVADSLKNMKTYKPDDMVPAANASSKVKRADIDQKADELVQDLDSGRVQFSRNGVRKFLKAGVNQKINERAAKSETMEKRSKNVREQTRNISPEQAEARRVRFAQKLGLNPKKVDRFNGEFPPNEADNTMNYSSAFPVEHEAGHYMMTPPGQHQAEYLHDISSREDDSHKWGDKYVEGKTAENVANLIESRFDRRAGVGVGAKGGKALPHVNRMRFNLNVPVGNDKQRETYLSDRNIKGGYKADKETAKDLNQAFGAQAKAHVERFDEGAKFKPEGGVQEPAGVNAKVNARAKKSLSKSVHGMFASVKGSNLQKAFRSGSKWSPERTDPEGFEHPDDKKYHKVTLPNGDAYWDLKPQYKEQEDSLVRALHDKYRKRVKLTPNSADNLHKLVGTILSDKLRHLRGTSENEPNHGIRTRTLKGLFNEKPGDEEYAVKDHPEGGITLTAARHSKNESNERGREVSTWRVKDGKVLSRTHAADAADLAGSPNGGSAFDPSQGVERGGAYSRRAAEGARQTALAARGADDAASALALTPSAPKSAVERVGTGVVKRKKA